MLNLLPSHLTVHPSHLQSLKKQNKAKNTKNTKNNTKNNAKNNAPVFAWDSHVIVEQVVANVAGVRKSLRNRLFRGVNRLFSKWWPTSRGVRRDTIELSIVCVVCVCCAVRCARVWVRVSVRMYV